MSVFPAPAIYQVPGAMLLVDVVAAAHDTAWTTIAETARELERAAR